MMKNDEKGKTGTVYLRFRKLEQVFEILIQRHEGLRTSFVDKDGKVLQVVY
jgi:hypothetical protein